MAEIGEILGGLMTGVGGAMERKGRAERELALEKLKAEFASGLRREEDDRKHKYNMDENDQRGRIQADNTRTTYGLMDQNNANDADRRGRNSMREIGARAAADRETTRYSDQLGDDNIVKERTLEDGTVVGTTRSGKVVPLKDNEGRPLKDTGGGENGGLTAGEKRAYDIFKADHTNEDANGLETVDRTGMYAAMKKENPTLYRKLKGSGAEGGDGGGGGGGGAQPPAGFNKAPDGNYYKPDPKRPGKYLKWTGGK